MRYHVGQLAVQRRAGGADQAERLMRGMRAELPEPARAFLAQQRLLVLAAADADGRVWATPLHGAPGFARATAPDVLAIDARPHGDDPLAGALGAGPVPAGLLAIEPATRRRMRVNGLVAPAGDGLRFHAEQVFSNCPKYIARREPSEPAGAIGAPVAATRGALAAGDLALVRGADTFFIATDGPAGARDASHRGGAPGFVHAEAGRISFPDYAGNAMFMTLGNLDANPAAGLLFVGWEDGATLQVSGRAAIDWSPARTAAFPGAERVVDLDVERVVATARAVPAPWRFLEASPFNPPAVRPAA
jgi:predicted pyridoxine 5'-phosphate oxidase superfamily flavin-nucleotide-binding protein